MAERDPNKRYQQKTYNKPAAGYNVPGKGLPDGSLVSGLPNGLQGDRKLVGLPDELPNESLSSAQKQAEDKYNKIK